MKSRLKLQKAKCPHSATVCPRSLYIISTYYKKWVKTSRLYSKRKNVRILLGYTIFVLSARV